MFEPVEAEELRGALDAVDGRGFEPVDARGIEFVDGRAALVPACDAAELQDGRAEVDENISNNCPVPEGRTCSGVAAKLGENTAHRTALLCPTSTRKLSPDDVHHRRAVPS